MLCVYIRTVRKNSRCSDLDTRKDTNMIKYCTSVPMALCKMYESSDINTFGTITNPRTDGNCYIICSKIKYKILYQIGEYRIHAEYRGSFLFLKQINIFLPLDASQRLFKYFNDSLTCRYCYTNRYLFISLICMLNIDVIHCNYIQRIP